MNASAPNRNGAEPPSAEDRLLAGLTGRVIEVGAGNGMNFSHYPSTVTEVVAVEPDDHLRVLADQATARAAARVRVVAGHATALPAEDASFDAAVTSLVLCSFPDVPAALAEIRGYSNPAASLFFRTRRSAKSWLGLLEDAITPLWSRVAVAVTRIGTPRRRFVLRDSPSQILTGFRMRRCAFIRRTLMSSAAPSRARRVSDRENNGAYSRIRRTGGGRHGPHLEATPQRQSGP